MKYFKSILSLFFISLLFFFSRPVHAEGSAAIKLGIGLYPNLLHQAENAMFFNLREVNRRLYRLQGAYNDYYGDRVQVSNIKTGGDMLLGVPVDIGFRYFWKSFFFNLGFVYIPAVPDFKSYTLKTLPGVDSTGKSTQNFYEDYMRNADADLENDIQLAKGLIRTGGKTVIYNMFVSAKSIEIPFIMGISIFANESSNFYIGLGAVFMYGQFVRTITNKGIDGKAWTGDKNKADVDRFSGTAMGFQFLMGIEKKITSRFGYVFEIAMNFGALMPIQDEVKTDSNTLDSLFHSNKEEDLGGSEEIGSITRPGFPKLSGLLFTGYRFSFGLTYYVAFAKNYEKQVVFKKRKLRRKVKVKKETIDNFKNKKLQIKRKVN